MPGATRRRWPHAFRWVDIATGRDELLRTKKLCRRKLLSRHTFHSTSPARQALLSVLTASSLVAARLASSAGLVVVQASRQARCGFGGTRPWPSGKPVSKQSPRQRQRSMPATRTRRLAKRERATATSHSAGPVTLCGAADRSSRAGSGSEGPSQWQSRCSRQTGAGLGFSLQAHSGARRFGDGRRERCRATTSQHQARAADRHARATRGRFGRGDRAAAWLAAAYRARGHYRPAQSRSRGDAKQGCQ